MVAEAAAQARRHAGQPLRIERKDLLDIVTEADLASEVIVIEGLRTLTPDAAFLAEESGASRAGNGARWIIDPLDGTINYARGLPWFSVTVAYQDGGEVQLGVTNAPEAGLTARYARGRGRDDRRRAGARLRQHGRSPTRSSPWC